MIEWPVRPATLDKWKAEGLTGIPEELAQLDSHGIGVPIAAGMHPAFSILRALAVLIAELSGARVGFLSDGTNSAGACLAGVLPHRGAAGKARDASGLTAAQMIDQPLKNYFLLGIEPEFDCANSAQALTAMRQAEFVVAMTPYMTDRMRDYADVLLPMNCFSETSGTFVNCEGRWQSFAAASRAPGGSRPGWKVLRVLGNLLELEGFEQNSSEQVRDALSQQIGEVSVDNTQVGETADAGDGKESNVAVCRNGRSAGWGGVIQGLTQLRKLLSIPR